MTDLQDQILDRLVGARVGVDWPDGPLTLAAAVVGGTKEIRFGLSDNDRGAKAEIGRRLGYPILVCEAIQGGNRGLAAEDDRRSFVMTVFSTIPLGGQVKRLAVKTQGRVACLIASRAHRHVCTSEGCPVAMSLQSLVGANDAKVTPLAQRSQYAVCPLYGKALLKVCRLDVRWAASNQERSIYAAYRAVRALCSGAKGQDAWASVRESVRLAANERGIGEAVGCCVEIARGCGMVF